MPKPLIPKQPIDSGLIDFEAVQRTRESLTLRSYQEEHLGFFLNNPRSIDMSEAGTGKTPVMCLWIYAQTQGGRVIWAMPKSLLAKNYEELLLWSNLTPEEITLVDGTKPQREKQIARKSTKVFIMGFDAFANNWEYMRSLYPNLVHLCIDEAHKGFSTHGERDYRNPNKFYGPRRTVMMYEYLRKGGCFLPATGTILNGRLSSCYPFISRIESRYYGTYKKFLEWHAILDDYNKPAFWKNHERLSILLNRHGKRITFEDAYGKENKEIFTIPCIMSTKQKKHYKEIEDRAITELDSGDLLEAKGGAMAIRKCLEIMQIPESLGINEGDEGKLAQLTNLLEDAKQENSPVLIFETVKAAQYKWCDAAKELGFNAAVMNGEVTGDNRQWMDKDFREGKIDVLVCSPDVAGVGFNWQHVNMILFMTLDWQDTTFIQNYRRALRGVRETMLKLYILMYRASIDGRIAQKINAKSYDRNQVEKGVEVRIRLPN